MRGFEAIVLAGGLGTRISSVLPDLPKVMADVGGRPFLEFLLEMAARNGVTRAILATGHLHAPVERHFGNRWAGIEIAYSFERQPLGTGGAVRLAMKMAAQDDLFVLNGDTFFDADLRALDQAHKSAAADVTIALKRMKNFSRYGAVDFRDGFITGFHEKRHTEEGCINGGIYLVDRARLERFDLPEKFSLEIDFLERRASELRIAGYVSDGYFIDIGVPEDYARAQRELPLRVSSSL